MGDTPLGFAGSTRNQGAAPMSRWWFSWHDAEMNDYLLYHRHASTDCAASFAAWSGFRSELRGATPPSTCAFGSHEIWWTVTAASERDALAFLPIYVADRTLAIRTSNVEIH